MSGVDHTYKQRTYEELSKEFTELYPSALRAFELIPLMYNRLTLVDGLSHKKALAKMLDDHKHFPGFATRNIYRYLPQDNPKIPRRVMTPRHNNSVSEGNDTKNFNVTKHEEDVVVELNDNDDHSSLIGERIDEQHNESYSSYKEGGSNSIDFELSLPFEDLHLHMQSIFREMGVHGKVWIHGTLDLRTGKVSYVSTGRIMTDVSNRPVASSHDTPN
jgi:hypothetical protein